MNETPKQKAMEPKDNHLVYPGTHDGEHYNEGPTKLEYLAEVAMWGIIVAELALDQAKVLIDELNKQQHGI